jgi:hypothetical protein
MSELSGSLEDFPLPDVLRLLSKGSKDGVLHMYGDVVRGRVYLVEGKISYATTRESDDFAEGNGSEGRKNEDRRRVKLGEVSDDDPELFTEVLRLQIVEVLVRLGRETSGSFVFQNGVSPQEAVKEPFEVDDLLIAAEAELKEWHRIEAIIGTTSTPLRMVTGVADDQKITLDGTAWNALAALGAGDSTRSIAERLNVFEIVAARVMARLVEDELVEIVLDPKAAGRSAEPQADRGADERPLVVDDPLPEPEPEHEAELEPEPEPAVLPEPAEIMAERPQREEARARVADEDNELSEQETREVLSALSAGRDTDEPRTSRSLGFEGLGDDPEDEPDSAQIAEDGEAPPASELARRWRNLRAGNPE